MLNQLDLNALKQVLAAVPGLEFALLFGSISRGTLPRPESDIDVAVYCDHEPTVDERAQILGLIQDVVKSDRVDLVFLNLTDNPLLQREVLYGQLLFCRDAERYASFFSIADRRGRDERARLQRAWAMRRELRLQGDLAQNH